MSLLFLYSLGISREHTHLSYLLIQLESLARIMVIGGMTATINQTQSNWWLEQLTLQFVQVTEMTEWAGDPTLG